MSTFAFPVTPEESTPTTEGLAVTAPDEGDAFDYVQLGDVDPTFKPFDVGVYRLKVLRAFRKKFTYKRGDRIGQEGSNVNITFAITEHPQLSGRRVFERLQGRQSSFKYLRRLADETGIHQEPTETIDEWLVKIAAAQPEVKARVRIADETDMNGEKVQNNRVVWTSITRV